MWFFVISAMLGTVPLELTVDGFESRATCEQIRQQADVQATTAHSSLACTQVPGGAWMFRKLVEPEAALALPSPVTIRLQGFQTEALCRATRNRAQWKAPVTTRTNVTECRQDTR
jgi:hypothetical protein